MNLTPFPSRPEDVTALTVQEFTRDIDLGHPPSLDAICTRFFNDSNRALTWRIRFDALMAWRARPEVADWLGVSHGRESDAFELAASFLVTDHWEFEATTFCAAIERTVRQQHRRVAS